jgi:hypothetical protein
MNVRPRSIGRNVAVRELIVSSPWNNHAQTHAIRMALTLDVESTNLIPVHLGPMPTRNRESVLPPMVMRYQQEDRTFGLSAVMYRETRKVDIYQCEGRAFLVKTFKLFDRVQFHSVHGELKRQARRIENGEERRTTATIYGIRDRARL